MKKCSKCHKYKSLYNFYKSYRFPGKLGTQCKLCISVRHRKRREKKLGKKSRFYGNTGEYKKCFICKTLKYFAPVFIRRNKTFYCSETCSDIGHSQTMTGRRWGKGAATKRRKLGVIRRATLRELHEHCDGRCYYCQILLTYNNWPSLTFASVDHIIPVARNGTNDLDNLCVCCLKCNWSKRDKLLSEWKLN